MRGPFETALSFSSFRHTREPLFLETALVNVLEVGQ